MKKHKLILGLFIFICSVCHSQDLPKIIPPTPEAANISRYADIPVSLYSGKPQIEFPLYTLKCGNLELPISLSYYASGVKVEEHSTWAGIGWALNAGGVITRTIKGSSFLQSGNNLGEYLPLSEKTPTEQFNALVNLEYHNKEADIFYYNFSKFSGSFQIKNNKPVFRKHANLKIEFLFNLSSITITDENGIKYYFESKSSGEFQTDYYLVKMESADNLHAIYFEYIKGDLYGSPPHHSAFYTLYPTVLPVIPSPSTENYEVKHSGYLLSRIYTSNNDSVEFLKKNIQQPNESALYTHRQALNYINIYNRTNKIESFHFKVNNIQTTKPYSDPYSSECHIPLSNTKEMNYRLYLDGFDKMDTLGNVIESYNFEYYGRTADGKDSLPNRFSLAQDLGGYYNGQDNNTTLIPTLNERIRPDKENYFHYSVDKVIDFNNYGNPTMYGIIDVNIPGGNRDPDLQYMKMGTLKSIKYPSGGYAKFYFSQLENPMTSEPYYGLKIDRIEYLDSDGSLQKKKEYIYSNSVLSHPIPSNWHYMLVNQNGWTSQATPYPNICNDPVLVCDSQEGTWKWAIEISPGSANDFGLNEGPMIGYGHVREIEEGNGYTDYEFSTEGRCNEEVKFYGFPVIGLFDGGVVANIYNIQNAWPYGPFPNESWKMGTLLNKTTHSEVGTIKEDVWYHYSHHVLDVIPGLKSMKIPTFHMFGMDNPDGTNNGDYHDTTFFYYEFEYLSTWERLDSITETIDGVTKTTSYTYDDRKQVTQKTTTSSRGDILTTTFTYPYDYASSVYLNMVAKNMIAPVIEKTETNNGVQTSLVKTNYSFWKTIESHNNLISGHLEVEKGINNSQTTTFNVTDTAKLTINFDLWKNGDGYFVLEGYGPPKIHQASGIVETTLSPGNYTLQLSFPESTFPSTDFYATADYSVDIADIEYNMTMSNDITNHIYPLSVEVKKGENLLETKLNYNSYDNKGNILSVSKTNDIETIYLWGYNFQYPIAKIENVTYSQVSSLVANLQLKSDQDDDRQVDVINSNGTISYQGNEGALRSALTSLRDSLPNAMVTTYTYDPLIGVTSITDSKGYTTYYEYDEFNRLKQVKDQDGKILSKNEYHYKDQQ